MKTKPTKEKTVLFNVRLPESVIQDFRRVAARTHMSQTEMAITALRNYLNHPKLKEIARMQEEISRSFNPAPDQSLELRLAA